MGLPQGSVLSPILFNIFMHNLPTVVSNKTKLSQFADDISMNQNITLKSNTSKKSIQKIEKNYQTELDNIHHYLNENGLSLSLEKTKIILFNRGPDPPNIPNFKIGEFEIENVKEITFLGLTLTSKLSWSNHFEKIINKCRNNINLLKVIAAQKWGKKKSTLRTLAIALVRSKLTYAQEVFF